MNEKFVAIFNALQQLDSAIAEKHKSVFIPQYGDDGDMVAFKVRCPHYTRALPYCSLLDNCSTLVVSVLIEGATITVRRLSK